MRIRIQGALHNIKLFQARLTDHTEDFNTVYLQPHHCSIRRKYDMQESCGVLACESQIMSRSKALCTISSCFKHAWHTILRTSTLNTCSHSATASAMSTEHLQPQRYSVCSDHAKLQLWLALEAILPRSCVMLIAKLRLCLTSAGSMPWRTNAERKCGRVALCLASQAVQPFSRALQCRQRSGCVQHQEEVRRGPPLNRACQSQAVSSIRRRYAMSASTDVQC